jgi:hypothetical protein
VRSVRLNCPSCRPDAGQASSEFQKWRLTSSPNQKCSALSRLASKRGVSADRHDTWGAGCGGRFGDAHDSFVRTNGAVADAKACGPGLPTLRPSRVVTSRAMTGAIKPGPRGERAISVKTIAQGMPDDLAEPVVFAASFSICWRAMGCGQHPAFPVPSLFRRAKNDASLGRCTPRERRVLRQRLFDIRMGLRTRKRCVHAEGAPRSSIARLASSRGSRTPV